MSISLQRLREQVEFYFGDSNYSRDQYMIERAAENDGWIPIPVLLTFKRIESMKATLEDIKKAVEGSKVVEANEDSLRKMHTQEYMDYINDKNISKRVVYMKGFGIKMNLDDVREVISQHFNPVRVTMRRNEEKEFRGSCFVECASAEQAEEVLKMKIEVPAYSDDNSSKKQKRDPVFLEIMAKDEYLARHRKTEKPSKKDKFAEKVKASFIPRLYRYECDKPLEIQHIKNVVERCGFVDTLRKVVKMEHIEDWKEKEFDAVSKEDDQNTIRLKLVKLSEDEAREYVKNIRIKKTGGRKN